MSQALGIAATGHAETSRAAAEILKAGGNAFDAAVGALAAACVAEPLMASLAGGGFLLARQGDGNARVYDFFCQTPASKRAERDLDFFPIIANFGEDTQEFHMGMGAMAVPGCVAGMFRIHRDLGRMPMADILTPAKDLARRGVRMDALQHYIVRILEALLRADSALFGLFESPSRPGELISNGELLRNPGLADALEQLAGSGEEVFYRGAWAEQLARDSAERGGHLSRTDLAAYRVELREPLRFIHRGARCVINPPPSPGGCLIAFVLALLSEWLPQDGLSDGAWGEPGHVRALLRAFRAASLTRQESGAEGPGQRTLERLLDGENLARWRSEVQWDNLFSRGTTHISIADRAGNVASLSASNGEGNTYVLPGTGIILNNMLGEEDLNPGGFHRWRENGRLASMMSPMIAQCADGSVLALGTGGSNRIRSAICQVVVNILDFGLPLAAAVNAPRLHLEQELLSIEPGFGETVLRELRGKMPALREWPALNLFFGGLNAVRFAADGRFEGAGDPRRQGAVAIA